MRGNVHVRFGGRAGDTAQWKHRHRAPARSLHRASDKGGQGLLLHVDALPGQRLDHRVEPLG